jgi:hypothetical protein
MSWPDPISQANLTVGLRVLLVGADQEANPQRIWKAGMMFIRRKLRRKEPALAAGIDGLVSPAHAGIHHAIPYSRPSGSSSLWNADRCRHSKGCDAAMCEKI